MNHEEVVIELIVVGLCSLLLALVSDRAKLRAFPGLFAVLGSVILVMAMWQAWNGR